MKTVYVILGFHAHEPLWDLPRHLQRSASDRRVAAGITPESYVRRRMREGRNAYRDLLGLCDRLQAPVVLDVTNELLHQLRRTAPATVRDLVRACNEGAVHPIYTAAHHTHAVFLDPEELLDELRLNAEMLHDVLGMPRPARRGLFFTECSFDARFFPALEAAGYEFTIGPDLDRPRVDFRCEDADHDLRYRPFRLGSRLVALPRHFRVSQEVWRPLTLRYPERVKYQGFAVGRYAVFPEEYAGAPLRAPIDDPAAGVTMYADVLRSALAEAPDGGLILYVQDLELMDFGEAALSLLGDAWSAVIAEAVVRVEFVSPAEYLRASGIAAASLPGVRFWRASWAPELRPALRPDGHYPPRGAGPLHGIDAEVDIFRRRPFVFWEPGLPLTRLFEWLLDRFGYDRRVAADAATLSDENYRLDRFPVRVRLPLLLRLMKRACNWGWYPEEGLGKRPYLDGLLIADALRLEARLRRTEAPPLDAPLPPGVLAGLARLPEIVIDGRIEYLRFGLERLREERGFDAEPALLELARAAESRGAAADALSRVAEAYRKLGSRADGRAWIDLLEAIRSHCTAVFLAYDHLQRAWGAADPDFLVEMMYRWIYDRFPPRGPLVLDQIDAMFAPRPIRIAGEPEAAEPGPVR